jgi:ribosomal protein L7Ae-like RNA K-turn-binding protein
MPKQSKLTSAIGFAMKAGRLKSGDFVVEKLVRANKAKLVLIDKAASDNTKDKYRALCRGRRVEQTEVFELGSWIGKPGRMVAAVTDEGFANMIKRASAEEETAQGE